MDSRRAIVVSVVVASVAVTASALVGIGVMLGWVGDKPATSATPARPAPAATDALLSPGETLVAPAAAPSPSRAPLMPNYTPPKPPLPAPAVPDAAPPPPREPKKVVAAPVPPQYRRPPAQDERCRNCGTVAAIATYPDAWEVRVRFEDGSERTIAYPTAPRLRLGDRVRLEEGRLNRY